MKIIPITRPLKRARRKADDIICEGEFEMMVCVLMGEPGPYRPTAPASLQKLKAQQDEEYVPGPGSDHSCA